MSVVLHQFLCQTLQALIASSFWHMDALSGIDTFKYAVLQKYIFSYIVVLGE